MKATGIVRRVDDLGRVVIPKEIRRIYNISECDSMEIYTDNDRIILKKYVPSNACVFCGGADNTVTLDNKHVCMQCAIKINDMLLQK